MGAHPLRAGPFTLSFLKNVCVRCALAGPTHSFACALTRKQPRRQLAHRRFIFFRPHLFTRLSDPKDSFLRHSLSHILFYLSSSTSFPVLGPSCCPYYGAPRGAGALANLLRQVSPPLRTGLRECRSCNRRHIIATNYGRRCWKRRLRRHFFPTAP